MTSSECVAIGNTLSHESIRVALWMYIFMFESRKLLRVQIEHEESESAIFIFTPSFR